MQAFEAFPSNPAFKKRAIALISKWATSAPQSNEPFLINESPIRWNGSGEPPKNWLGSPIVLRKLLADFTVSCLKRHPDLAPDCLDDQDDAAAMRVAGILLGKDSNYIPVKGWNEPGRIDRHLEKLMSGGASDPCRSIAEFLKADIMIVANAGMVLSMGGGDEADCESMVINQLETTVAFLLGVDAPEEE